MSGVLRWLLGSPLRMGLVAAALSLSRLFDLFGAAVIALATLRAGLGGAALVLAIAAPVVIAVSLVSGAGMMLALAVFTLWLPVIGLSLVLRRTGSLALMTQAAALLAALVVGAWFGLAADPLASIRTLLQEFLLPLMGADDVPAERIEAIAAMMPASMAGAAVLLTSVTVMLGRWWQAIVYNPGGFRHDFHRLRQGRVAAALVAAVVLVAFLTGHPVAGVFAYTGAVTLLLQGLAMVHGVVAASGQPAAWLWGMYALMFFLPLPAAILLAFAGGVDNWLDLRRHAGLDADR